jgi:queuine/archaeosine tRNA-ribosyltransferase
LDFLLEAKNNPIYHRLDERPQEVSMGCLICRNLERAYEEELKEYMKALSSASYQFCTLFAAKKNVDMERAKYELEEHQKVCLYAEKIPVYLPERQRPKSSRRAVA